MDFITMLQTCHTSDIIRDSGTSCLVIRKPPLIRFSPFNSQSSLHHGLLQPYSKANALGYQVNNHLQKKFLQPKLTGQKNIQITFLHGFCDVTCKQPRIATAARTYNRLWSSNIVWIYMIWIWNPNDSSKRANMTANLHGFVVGWWLSSPLARWIESCSRHPEYLRCASPAQHQHPTWAHVWSSGGSASIRKASSANNPLKTGLMFTFLPKTEGTAIKQRNKAAKAQMLFPIEILPFVVSGTGPRETPLESDTSECLQVELKVAHSTKKNCKIKATKEENMHFPPSSAWHLQASLFSSILPHPLRCHLVSWGCVGCQRKITQWPCIPELWVTQNKTCNAHGNQIR